MAKKDLYSSTLDLLRSDPRTIDEIADAVPVNRHWLAKLLQGRFKNPGVVTIEKLHDHLHMTRKGNRAKQHDKATDSRP